jgi:hypothetical protein
MSNPLLTFNPVAYGSGGDRLLFGVTVPTPASRLGLSALEELNLANLFLEAQSPSGMTLLMKHIVRRVGAARGRTFEPGVAGALLRRLIRAAAAVRDALRSGDAGPRSPRSLEAIFGTELEGLSPEDQEFETARRFVRFAHEMTRVAADAPPGSAPEVVTSKAEHSAAHRLAPGLPRAIASPPMNFHARRLARHGW